MNQDEIETIYRLIEKNYGSGVMLQFAELVKGLEGE